MTALLRLKTDPEFKLSVIPDLYARALRAIGQDLAKLLPEKFEIEMAGDDFIARGHSLQQRLRAKDAAEYPLAKLWQSSARGYGAAGTGSYPSSTTPFVRTYTPDDIAVLDEAGKSRRDGRNKDAPDFHSLGEILRTIGRIVDAEEGKLIEVRKHGNSLTFQYLDRNGQTHNVDHSHFALYRIHVGHRSHRRSGGPMDMWQGMDR